MLTDTPWTNYKQAADLPPEMVEKMWRALDGIAESCEKKHPADVDFMTKDQIKNLCEKASPSFAE